LVDGFIPGHGRTTLTPAICLKIHAAIYAGYGKDTIVLGDASARATASSDFLNRQFPASFTAPSKPTRKSPKGAQAYKGNGKHKWEEVTVSDAGHTYRLRVPGGWLYRTVSYDYEASEVSHQAVTAQSTVFVPVPDAVGYAV
jgi:hypothetical protein